MRTIHRARHVDKDGALGEKSIIRADIINTLPPYMELTR